MYQQDYGGQHSYGPSYYFHDSTPSLTVVEKKKSRCNFCSCCAAVLFTILLIVVVASILMFLLNGTHWFVGGLEKIGFEIDRRSSFEPASRAERLAGFLTPCLTPPGGPEAAKFISLDEFENLKTREKVCIIDTVYFGHNGSEKYQSNHLMGANWFDVSQIVEETPTVQRELKHPIVLEKYAQTLGIDDDCFVILYDHSDYAKSLLDATYTWWIFKVHGYNNVQIINGGLNRIRNQLPVPPIANGSSPAAKNGDLIARWERSYYQAFDDVVDNFKTKTHHLIDAREKTDFDGQKDPPGKANGKGRIKGALNVPSNEILTTDGALLEDADLKQLLDNKGVVFSKKYIVYCNTGYQASGVFFAMKRLGYQVTIYPAGWVEFSNRASDDLIERP